MFRWKQKRGKEEEEEEVLTFYTCDTLSCSEEECRQSRNRRKESHRKKDEGLRDGQAAHQPAKDKTHRLLSQTQLMREFECANSLDV